MKTHNQPLRVFFAIIAKDMGKQEHLNFHLFLILEFISVIKFYLNFTFRFEENKTSNNGIYITSKKLPKIIFNNMVDACMDMDFCFLPAGLRTGNVYCDFFVFNMRR